ncbi:MAG: hypothetical protein ABIW79_03120 [Gemmatimonas sp.]
MMRRALHLAVCAAVACVPSWVLAQAGLPGATAARAPGNSRVTVGAIYERVSFGEGILESDLAGADSVRVKSATGLAVPIGYSTVLGGVWMIDAGTSFTSGKRTVVGADTLESGLSGIGDIRVRLSRRFDRMGLRITFGANIPTGVTELDEAQTATLSVLGSPALGVTQPAVGFGSGATVGIVKSFASASRGWGVAIGGSMEWRGEYEPYAALAIGTPLDAYDPGAVIRLSAGASRLFGESKGLMTASLDLFGVDQVSPAGSTLPVEVQIGPTFAIDAQWLPATTRIKNAALFGALQLRSALTRDDTELPNSGNVMFEAGARGARAMSDRADLLFEVSARVLTAVEIDNRLATAASTSLAPSVGFAVSSSSWTVRPMATARFGTVDTGLESGSFSVLGARLTFERRF